MPRPFAGPIALRTATRDEGAHPVEVLGRRLPGLPGLDTGPVGANEPLKVQGNETVNEPGKEPK